MIIFLYGSDSYRRQQKTKELITAYRQKHPNFDFRSFDLTEKSEDYLGLQDFFNQQSLFDNFKMALLRGTFESEAPKIKPILKEQLTRENFILLLSEEKKPTKEFNFLLKEPVRMQEFESLTAGRLGFFIRKEAEKRNLNFTPEAKQYLAQWQERGQTDCWSLINELDKIALTGFSPPITAKNLESLIPFFYQEKIYYLARILGGRNSPNKKMVALERLLIQKEPAAYVFNLLGYQATGPLLLKLADYDWQVKSGGLNYEEVLLDLALANN